MVLTRNSLPYDYLRQSMTFIFHYSALLKILEADTTSQRGGAQQDLQESIHGPAA